MTEEVVWVVTHEKPSLRRLVSTLEVAVLI